MKNFATGRAARCHRVYYIIRQYYYTRCSLFGLIAIEISYVVSGQHVFLGPNTLVTLHFLFLSTLISTEKSSKYSTSKFSLPFSAAILRCHIEHLKATLKQTEGKQKSTTLMRVKLNHFQNQLPQKNMNAMCYQP